MTLAQEIRNRLHTVALKITDNFCYPCHKVVEGDYCPTCRSDDFMRHLEGVGAGYGTDWVISYLLITRLETVDGGENLESLADDGQLFEYCGYYYRLEDVEDLIEELEAE